MGDQSWIAVVGAVLAIGALTGARAATPAMDGATEMTATSREQSQQWTWAIEPHRPSYIMPLTYNSSLNNDPYREARPDRADQELDAFEAKFQFSFKLPLWRGMFGDSGDLSVGYTQLTLWQVYHYDLTDRIRETNYEPELLLEFHHDTEILGFRHRSTILALNHESNGRAKPLGRGWNRIYAALQFERGALTIEVMPWYRIPETEKGDRNPQMEKYVGYGELSGRYAWRQHTFSAMVRNNLRTENRGALQLDWSFPLYGALHAYVQYFTGYAETLIDYNHAVNRIGVGVILANRR